MTIRSERFRRGTPTPAEFVASLPTPATSEPGFTFQPVDKDGNPTNNPNERWYHPETGRLVQKGIKQVLDEGLLRTPSVTDSTGGAISEKQARERNRMVKVADQAAEIAHGNGLKVTESIANSLLPTPISTDWKNGKSSEGYGANLPETTRDLMPTPVASEGTKAPSQQTSETKGKTGQVWLSNVAKDLEALPTPTASDWKGANHSGSGSASSRGMATVVEQTNWGKFEPAIRRWEQVIERPAPSPTKPDGKDGNHRLSSKFTEWMMGLPDGWITDVGLTRNEELKACGNGVVPQQAELALRVLLEGIEIERGGEQVNLPTPTVSDTFTGNLKSTQQKPGSMHSVTLPQAVRIIDEH